MIPATRGSRARLLDAAEALFAERGVDAVSLREINAAAGQRNASGLQYHFGGRAGLLSAVIDRHMATVDRARHERLDELETLDPPAPVRAVMAALVEPLAERLADPSGRRYLQILGQLAALPESAVLATPPDRFNPSIARATRLLDDHGPNLPTAIARARNSLVTSFLLRALADRAGGPSDDDPSDEVFVAALVDALVAVHTGPVSDATADAISSPAV